MPARTVGAQRVTEGAASLPLVGERAFAMSVVGRLFRGVRRQTSNNTTPVDVILSQLEDTENQIRRQITPIFPVRAATLVAVEPVVLVGAKVVLVGDSNVGKSSICRRVSTGEFEVRETPTIGYACLHLSIQLPGEGSQSKALQLWDTAGQERYRSMIKSFYRSAVVAIVVFAIDSRTSFEAIAGWVEAVKLEAPSAWLVLVGNKKDVARREVEHDEAARMAEQLGCNSYRE